MDRPMPDIAFIGMSILLRFRDLLRPRGEILKEVGIGPGSRVLKPAGILSFSDHHMKRADIVSGVTQRQLFTLKAEGTRTYSFLKRV